jgi:hypothetical protein
MGGANHVRALMALSICGDSKHISVTVFDNGSFFDADLSLAD